MDPKDETLCFWLFENNKNLDSMGLGLELKE